MLRTASGDSFTSAIQHFTESVPGPEMGPRIWIHILNPDSPLISAAAMVDTGATWSVFGPKLWERLELPTGKPLMRIPMSTRLGKYEIDLYRARIGNRAEVGDLQLEIDATIGLGSLWDGPPVIGYQGFLDRLRFAVDPGERHFHFAPLA